MLNSVSNYFYERRGGFARFTGYSGALYLAGTYAKDRLVEVKDRVLQERKARDNLRRWFENNQQNISYTIMALLPTIGEHIVEGMDVEGLTNDLQEKSRAARLSRTSRPSSPDGSPVRQDHDSRSDMGSSVISSIPEDSSVLASTSLGESTRSWVQDFSATSRNNVVESSPDPSALAYSSTESAPGSSRNGSPSRAMSESSMSPGPARTKAELWREVKILTFTRTLTTLYSLTLLSLFNHIQLSLLSRSKYIQSILDQERDERLREQLEYQLSIYSLFWSNQQGQESEAEVVQTVTPVDEETEMKYLTLSWWICNIGWKDVGERVRRGVEEVFDEVSLKEKLGAIDLHRLVCDVRRRVEHEITFEGQERKINFASTLLPPTPDSMQHILIQGGIPPSLAMNASPEFTELLNETRSVLASPDFSVVLEVCLDRATEILFDGLKKNVFVETGSGDEEVKLRLAGMLPGLARWSHLALHGLPNELIDGLATVREVEAFSAIIFSRFEERFV